MSYKDRHVLHFVIPCSDQSSLVVSIPHTLRTVNSVSFNHFANSALQVAYTQNVFLAHGSCVLQILLVLIIELLTVLYAP